MRSLSKVYFNQLIDEKEYDETSDSAETKYMTGDRSIREVLSKIVGKIVQEYHPKKVILFGSYAHGKPTKDSDVDILLVTERRLHPEETYEIQRQFLKEFSIPLQLICVSDEDFTETKDVIGGITYPAAKYGEMLYAKP